MRRSGECSRVALGAFGAHFFKSRLAAQDLITYDTSVRYLLIHAMALVALGLLNMRLESFGLKLAGWLFITGILLFLRQPLFAHRH